MINHPRGSSLDWAERSERADEALEELVRRIMEGRIERRLGLEKEEVAGARVVEEDEGDE